MKIGELKKTIQEAVKKYHSGETEVKRFSISLSVAETKRLDRLAKKMNTSRQGIISLLLPPALRDLEIELEQEG